MKLIHGIYIFSSAVLVACVHSSQPGITIPTGQLHRVTTDYAAIGDASNIQPFVYNDQTMIRKDMEKPQFNRITDEQGNSINFTEQDGYYVVESALDTFIISGSGRTVKFERYSPKMKEPTGTEALTPNSNSSSDKNEDLSTEIKQDTNASANVDNSTTTPDTKITTNTNTSNADIPIFELMKHQLTKQRELLDRQAAKEAKLQKELSDIQTKLTANQDKMESGTAVVHVHFPLGSTVFKPEKNLSDVLISAAQQAKNIMLFGRTDSRIADTVNKRIARGRALQVRDYLIKQGVSAEKIRTFSQSAGDFIVPSNAKDRSLNRRVTIEMAMR